jgi:hypothetical protein
LTENLECGAVPFATLLIGGVLDRRCPSMSASDLLVALTTARWLNGSMGAEIVTWRSLATGSNRCKAVQGNCGCLMTACGANQTLHW